MSRRNSILITLLFVLLVAVMAYLQHALEGGAGAPGPQPDAPVDTPPVEPAVAAAPAAARTAGDSPARPGGDGANGSGGPGDAVALVESDPVELEKARVVQQIETTMLLYDRSDYSGAADAARAILRQYPDNIRMLRVLIAASCILGDAETAREHYRRVATATDREHVETVCAQNDIELHP